MKRVKLSDFSSLAYSFFFYRTLTSPLYFFLFTLSDSLIYTVFSYGSPSLLRRSQVTSPPTPTSFTHSHLPSALHLASVLCGLSTVRQVGVTPDLQSVMKNKLLQ